MSSHAHAQLEPWVLKQCVNKIYNGQVKDGACYCGSEAFLPDDDFVCKNGKLVNKNTGESYAAVQKRLIEFPLEKQDECKLAAGTVGPTKCFCGGKAFDPNSEIFCHNGLLHDTSDLNTDHAKSCVAAGGWPSNAYILSCECEAGVFNYPYQKCVDGKKISWVGKSVQISGKIEVAKDEFQAAGYRCDHKEFAEVVTYDHKDYCTFLTTCNRQQDGAYIPFSTSDQRVVCNIITTGDKRMCTGPSKCINSNQPSNDVADPISYYMQRQAAQPSTDSNNHQGSIQ